MELNALLFEQLKDQVNLLFSPGGVNYWRAPLMKTAMEVSRRRVVF